MTQIATTCLIPPGTINEINILKPGYPIGYVSPGSPNFDYHLTSGSPANDQAIGSSLSIDIDNQSRPSGAAPDLGADEFSMPSLEATPSSIFYMTDTNLEFSFPINIDASDGSSVGWTATTSANWLYIGATGTSKVATGVTGNELTVRFAPAYVNYGTYNGVINITSPDAVSFVVNVRLMKVSELNKIFLPVVKR